MSLVSKLFVSMFAMTLMVAFSGQALAADAATGSITGTVTGADGKPAANVSVKVMAPPKPGDAPKPAPKADKPAAGEKPKAPAAIKEGTTNDKGEFTLTDVPAGEYVVAAGSKEAGQGREKVTVKAGEKATVSITLKMRKAK